MCLGYKVLLLMYGNHSFMYDFLQKEGHGKESSQGATAILFLRQSYFPCFGIKWKFKPAA